MGRALGLALSNPIAAPDPRKGHGSTPSKPSKPGFGGIAIGVKIGHWEHDDTSARRK
jgi:hypothetical protein